MRHALIVIVCLVVSSAGALVAAAGNDLDVVEKVLTAPPATGLVVSLVRDDSRAEQAGMRSPLRGLGGFLVLLVRKA